MTEAKFPQDYTEDEWVAMHPYNPANVLQSPEEHEAAMRDDHRYRKAGVGGLLYEAGKHIKACVDDDGKLKGTVESFNTVVNQALALVAIGLDGGLPHGRYQVMEYVCGGLGDDGLIEAIRHHPDITQHYWDKVNG